MTSQLFLEKIESMEYYQNLNYYWTPWFAVYEPNPTTEKKERVEGWKTHIVIEKIEDYLFMTDHLLPVLRDKQIKHKVVYHAKFEEFNAFKDTQAGKILTIYDPALSFLRYCDEKILDFLKQDTDLKITSDKQIGGRVFVRYTGFSDDMVWNPTTNELEFMPRIEGMYKPFWIEEPSSFLNFNSIKNQ